MLTTEQIAALEPGEETDALIAENIFGYEVRVATEDDSLFSICMAGNCGDRDSIEPGERYLWIVERGHQPERRLPGYSTDIGAAWEILDKLTLPAIKQLPDGRWQVVCLVRREPELVTASASDDTAPMAICKAALACRTALAAVKGEGDGK